MKSERIIIGIDPGTIVLGYGIISVKGQKAHMINMGIVSLNKYDNHYIKLKKIYNRITSIIDEYLPDEMAIEAPFYGANIQSMLKLGRAQGSAMIAALNRDIPITEYQPRRVKQAITGNGSASKEQVSGMLQYHLNISNDMLPKYLDATDALAVALCHHFLTSNNIRSAVSGASKNWADFIKNNPERVKK